MIFPCALLAALAVAAAEPPLDEERVAVARASNAFAMDLYQVVRESTPGNVVSSPLSAGAALALLWAGARGDTAQELRDALHLRPDAAPPRTLAATGALLAALQASGKATLRVANRLFVRPGLELDASFAQLAAEALGAGVQETSFPDEGVAAVNAWVERYTGGKIKDLFAHGDLDELTVMVLVNSIYFLGNWEVPFSPSATRPMPFHVSADETDDVSMMNVEGLFSYGRIPQLNATVLELPYEGEAMSMVLVLPEGGGVEALEALEAALPALEPSQLRPPDAHFVVAVVPRFRVASALHLHALLPKLGVRRIFEDSADLSGLAAEEVHVDKVLQKAFVEVTETGTVAAAATGTEVANRIGHDIDGIFKADHPFMFLIMHGDTVVFMGRVVNPNA